MLQITHFQPARDLNRLEDYLRARYLENHNSISWLPERLHDLIYRVSAQETDEGKEKSMDYIFLWEENGEIAACILPDGENIYVSIKNGFEQLFPSMVDFSEKNCLPLFAKADDGSVKFWVAISDSLMYMRENLTAAGYREYEEKEYANCNFPMAKDLFPIIPEGFRLLYGEEYPDAENKWGALRLGFHPDCEASDYAASMSPYFGRQKSSMYPDSFECIAVDEYSGEKNNVCAYCFVYVDQYTKTALIEPVSTREKYRHKGIGTALMHAAVLHCRKLGIEKCYVNSFGRRKEFYNAAGFFTESSISFWYKILR